MTTEKQRVFIAIDLNDEIHREIQNIQNHLQKADVDTKWIKKKNIHLTLKFLGDITVDQITAIQDELVRITKDIKPFFIKTEKIGLFPSHQYPRIIWLGIKNEPAILNLASKIDQCLKNYTAHDDQRDFKPHMTIGRIKSNRHIKKLIEIIEKDAPRPPMEQEITSISLFKSRLTFSGPIYSLIKEFPINK